MSIASALTALAGDIENARDAIEAKGGTVTEDGGSSQLAEDIASIPSGGPDTLDEYLNKTLVRFRTEREFTLADLQPGWSGSTERRPGLLYWEIPNNTKALPTWYLGNCQSLVRVDIGKSTNVANVSLSRTWSLKYLILRKTDAITTLYSSDSVSFASGGKIYVPPTLIEEYKVATNWSAHTARFNTFLIADTVAQKNAMLADPTIADGTMIICDVDATYTVKGEAE